MFETSSQQPPGNRKETKLGCCHVSCSHLTQQQQIVITMFFFNTPANSIEKVFKCSERQPIANTHTHTCTLFSDSPVQCTVYKQSSMLIALQKLPEMLQVKPYSAQQLVVVALLLLLLVVEIIFLLLLVAENRPAKRLRSPKGAGSQAKVRDDPMTFEKRKGSFQRNCGKKEPKNCSMQNCNFEDQCGHMCANPKPHKQKIKIGSENH